MISRPDYPGANGLLVTYSAGLGAFRELTSHPDINVPVMLHASHMIAMMKQIAWPVLAKLCRPQTVQPEVTNLIRDIYETLVRVVIANELPRREH